MSEKTHGVKTMRKSEKEQAAKRINYNLRIGAVITITMCVFILIGFVYTPYNPEAMDETQKLAGISWHHFLGCDNFGRDIFSRVLKGSGTTLLVATGTILIGTGAGIILGALTGYYGGWLDEILMRINDAIFAFPSILLALVFISLLGTGTVNIVIALGIAFIPSFARIVRSEFLRCKNMDYVKQAKLIGAGDLRIMFVHILPNTLPVLLSSVMIGFNNAVLAEAGMSYLGIGVQPPFASLGRMLSEAQAYLFTRPGYALSIGIFIILLVLGFGLLGEGIKELK